MRERRELDGEEVHGSLIEIFVNNILIFHDKYYNQEVEVAVEVVTSLHSKGLRLQKVLFGDRNYIYDGLVGKICEW